MKYKILLGVAIVIVLAMVIALPIILTEKTPELVQDPECRPLILAHRGASGYVPEHTLGAYALAITMGADYVEPDLVMTKDGHMIARHDNQLDLTTDVFQRPEFAARRRTQIVDGSNITGWFTEDFTLDEVKTLRAVERIPNIRPGNARMDEAFDVPTLQEIIDLVKAMEKNEIRLIGIYPEIKHGVHFQRLGLPMEKPLVDALHENGYVGKNARAFIQSFEVSNLIQLRELTDLRLIQLLNSNPSLSPYDQYLLGTELTYGQMATAEGLRTIAAYADAVGPDKSYIIPRTPDNRLGNATDFVENAHAAGLLVHPYTFRSENLYLPEEYRSGSADMLALGDARGEMSAFLATGIDGLFADQPDVAVSLREPCYT